MKNIKLFEKQPRKNIYKKFHLTAAKDSNGEVFHPIIIISADFNCSSKKSFLLNFFHFYLLPPVPNVQSNKKVDLICESRRALLSIDLRVSKNCM